MKTSLVVRRRVSRLLLAAIGFSLVAGTSFAQRPNYLLFTDPQKRYSVEFPKDWQWMMVSGSGEPLVTFVQPRKEAAVVVERYRMRVSLGRDQVTDTFEKIETDLLKENQPRASDVASKTVTQNGRRLILIDYTRPGIDTRERVRQYSYPVGQDLYRITCMAVSTEFSKYESTCETVASSLKGSSELGPAAPATRK
jgi:photosystem II reaction center protein PsbP